MPKIALLFCIFSLFVGNISAQKKPSVSIEGLEKQRFVAMCNKDTSFLEKVIADDLVYTHSNALVESKKDFIASITSGKIVYEKIAVEEMTVRRFGSNTAIINGIVYVNVLFNAQPLDLRLRYTDVYVKQNKMWKLATWQSTKIP